MSPGLHHALLGLASLALFAAGHRAAARMSDRPLERIVAAFVLAAAAAVAEALLMGLVALGSDPWALTGASLLTYAAAAVAVPAPDPPTAALLAARWQALGRGERAAGGALAGAALLLLAWPLRYPLIGFDGAVYHLPEIAGWVASGHPGGIEQVSYLFPFANYPVTNEVALTWAVGISRSIVPVVIWSQVLYVATAGAALLGLAALSVPRPTRLLATAAVLSTPVLLTQLSTPSTDIAGLCWLICSAALAACATRRPALAAPALVAAGLAVGTKTTTVPLVVAVLALAGWRLRGVLPRRGRALAAAAALAALVGGTWYVRNAIQHGSPLWPFRSLPGGDPVPSTWKLIEPSLASRPHATIAPRASGYLDMLAGALVLVGGAAVAGLLSRRRDAIAAAAVALAAALLWAVAPSTGQPDTPVFDSNVLSTTRYALPAIAAAGVALALAAARGARTGPLARALLAAALAWNLVRDAQLGHLFVPYVWALAAAAAAGALAGAAIPPLLRVRRRALRPVAVLAALLAGAVLALPAGSLTRRQASVVPGIPGTAAAAWARAQPWFGRGGAISFAGTMIGQLAGDRLQHRLLLVPAGEDCAAVRARAARGVLVVADEPVFRSLRVRTPAGCMAGARPLYRAPGVRVYGRLPGPAS